MFKRYFTKTILMGSHYNNSKILLLILLSFFLFFSFQLVMILPIPTRNLDITGTIDPRLELGLYKVDILKARREGLHIKFVCSWVFVGRGYEIKRIYRRTRVMSRQYTC